jgi:UDP-glucose 4-epimerase
MVVLITGGAGYLGSHICNELVNQGIEDFISFDNLSTGLNENLIGPCVVGDISNKGQLRQVFDEYSIDKVIHVAGWHSIENAQFDRDTTIRNNFDTYENTLQKADMLLYQAKENGRNKIILENGMEI